MKLIVPMLIGISTVFVVFISVWRIGAVKIEQKEIELEIESAASYWIENYYVEMDTLSALFYDSGYAGDDYIEYFRGNYHDLLRFWNEFSLLPEMLSGVIIRTKGTAGQDDLYLDAQSRNLLYGYPESYDSYFEYARNISIVNPFLMSSFPVYAGTEELKKPFIYQKSNSGECLILLDYEEWRFGLISALDAAVQKKEPDTKELFSFSIEEGGAELTEYIVSSKEEEGFPLTLISFEEEYVSGDFSYDYSIPSGMEENGTLTYSISARSRLLNNYDDLQQDYNVYEHGRIDVLGNSVWGVFKVKKNAVLRSAIKIQLGAILLSYAALIFLIVLMFILVRYNHKAARLVKDQQVFISNVSHELRTPIAVICNAGTNLEQGYVKDTEHIRKYGRMITEEGGRLRGMVESIFLYSGFQLGKIKKELLIAETVVMEVVRPIIFLCEQKNIVFKYEIDRELRFEADREGIKSALMNLLNNAVIHGGSGGIISLAVGQSADKKYIEFRVEDNGPGIRRGEQKKIFHTFVRGTEAERLALPGSGLGLSLVKKVADLHGGIIETDSSVAGGAVFTLKLGLKDDDDIEETNTSG